MSDWLQEYADRLELDAELVEGALRVTSEQQESLLELARLVAHGTERKNAPLAAFLVGRFTACKGTGDAAVQAAILKAVHIADESLSAM